MFNSSRNSLTSFSLCDIGLFIGLFIGLHIIVHICILEFILLNKRDLFISKILSHFLCFNFSMFFVYFMKK